MGQKSSAETIAAIYQAFLHRRVWSQAELAREVGVEVPALRRRLSELAAAGMPLTDEKDHPHVYWSVPKEWFPGAVLFASAEVPELLRMLCRLPRSKGRDKLLRRVLEAAPRQSAEPERARTVVTREASESEESCLAVAEDAAARRKVLRFRYVSASRATLESRSASVQRIDAGAPARFLAVCHRDGHLKWFRIDRVAHAALDEGEAYRPAAEAEVERVLRESLDGFHQGSAPVRCSFVVRDPAARWVQNNLPGKMEEEAVPGGLRFSVTTGGLLPLARFVVGLGADAEAETAELVAKVEELARGALGARGKAAS